MNFSNVVEVIGETILNACSVKGTSMEAPVRIRNAHPSDYRAIISVLDEWWGGRRMSDMLPRLFFTHFCETSFISELDGQTIGFLIGFLSQSNVKEAYIHFVGVHPDFRKQGIGSELYKRFFQTAQEFGRLQIKCVTSPVNSNSINYHLRMGFEAEASDFQDNSVPYHLDYDGPGEHRVLFVKYL